VSPFASAQPEALKSKQVADVPLGMAQPKVVQDKQVEPDHGPADQVQDIDVPDLIDLTVAAKATDPLKKSHRLSVEFDGPALTAKQFNLLDSGPHRALGTAINQKLADGGLHAPRGVSKIEVNGEPVYCYFDETGKARAVLPKRIQDLPVEFHVKTLNLHVSEDALDFYRQIGKSGSGKKIKLGDSPAFNRLFTSCVLETLGKSIGVDPDDISGAHRKLSPLLREMLQPLDQGQRMVVQFKFGDAHWVADLSLRPGKKLSGINTDSFDSDVSITLSPLDAPLPEGAIATSQLNELAPQGLWDKNAHVKVSADYGGVRTTADAGYVKKFYQVSSNKSDFFEHLLASEEQSPGIANRMLVGVPTADMKKSIGPSGPLTILSKVPIPDARLEEFKLAAFTAVDDLFVLCRAGFAPPESRPEHFLLDPTADKLEIKMIDFGIGKHSDVQRRKKLFRDSVDILAGYVATALKNKSKDSARSPDEFAAEVRAYADKRLTSF
jgi:hypothetical protein